VHFHCTYQSGRAEGRKEGGRRQDEKKAAIHLSECTQGCFGLVKKEGGKVEVQKVGRTGRKVQETNNPRRKYRRADDTHCCLPSQVC
jgi:hypothetical protein